MKNWKLWGGYFSFVFLLASCASTAHIEKDDNTDFTRYKTFAWVEKEGKDGKGSKNADLTERKIREAVNKELEKTAGWRETKNNPDVLLSYDVLVERSSRTQSDPIYSNPFMRPSARKGS